MCVCMQMLGLRVDTAIARQVQADKQAHMTQANSPDAWRAALLQVWHGRLNASRLLAAHETCLAEDPHPTKLHMECQTCTAVQAL